MFQLLPSGSSGLDGRVQTLWLIQRCSVCSFPLALLLFCVLAQQGPHLLLVIKGTGMESGVQPSSILEQEDKHNTCGYVRIQSHYSVTYFTRQKVLSNLQFAEKAQHCSTWLSFDCLKKWSHEVAQFFFHILWNSWRNGEIEFFGLHTFLQLKVFLLIKEDYFSWHPKYNCACQIGD